ncbi:MAG: glutamine--fructose-6-phosphate transaminase (isomerizing) [Candidatus Nanohaloarchaeota archaeon]|nr:glutamine--fructose-6-phosphate transaminase (isomerizing) [Candidatus Nanohaloarchaeota archaeon]
MCGIIGAYSRKGVNSADLVEMLKKLEYRGYDSWGVSILTDKGLFIEKRVGRIGNVSNIPTIQGKAGIAHTRWATHGKVDEVNAHPHASFHNNVVLVHNGIIENYAELKAMLREKGYKFKTETDTEVAANLLEYVIKEERSIEDALKRFGEEVKGSFAIVAITENYMLALVRGSPLLIGRNGDEVYFASDAKAFVDKVREVAYFNDDEALILEINTGDLTFIDLHTKNKIEKDFEKVNKELYDSYEPLNGYPHYTLKEIEEQAEKIKEVFVYNEKMLDKLAEDINNAFGVFFIASGSSYNAALAASYLFAKHAHKHVNVVDASEFEYHKHFITPRTLVIAISQSGETADVIEAVKVAKNKGAKLVAITNMYNSTLMRLSDYAVLMHAGSEISVVATKTYTAQLLLLITLIFKTMGLEFNGEISKVSESIKAMLGNEILQEKLKQLAKELSKKEHLYLLGRGVNYATALEGALKIKEISYIHAEAFPGGALKHGSIALIDSNTDVIVIASEDETYDDIISNAMEVKARGGRIIGISSKPHEVFDVYVEVPKSSILQPILNIIPLQLLAYYLALERNADPDKPRNLAKSVTVK